MNENNPLASIVVLTYGHEKYIQKALDSILMQEVNFKYEIIVGEDCSPDGTRKILKEYERKYPEKFRMIYRDKNIGAHNNVQDIYKRCSGKYIAFLEGDDYWISSRKLQIQVDYLESHEECIATAHRVVIIDEYGNEKENESYPECKERLYTLKHYKKGVLPGQSATIVSRNIYNDKLVDTSIFEDESLVPGDKVKMFVLATHGNIYCFPEIMSAYRHITNIGTSFSATVNKEKSHQFITKINYYHTIMTYAKRNLKNREAIKTAETLYLFNAVQIFIKKGISWKALMKGFSEIEYKGSALLFLLFQITSWPVRFLNYKKRGNI